jgi:cytoskeletal protein RodZ
MSEEKLTLGEYFRRERENRGLDLKEIEERTKISAQTLIFLEEDQLEMLPPRTFLRGFLRVISKEFHFDEEELLAHLEETLASHELKKNKQARDIAKSNKKPLPLLLIIVIVIVLLVVIFGLSLKRCDQPQQGNISNAPVGTAYTSTHPEGLMNNAAS